MKIRLIDGRILSGENETEIVTKMRELETRGGPASELPLEEYMKLLVVRAKDLAETIKHAEIRVDYSYENFNPQLAGSIEEQCKNLITAILDKKIATLVLTKEELIAKIQNASPEKDQDFQEIISVVLDGGFISERELADELAISSASVSRYKIGVASPHPIIRKAIFEYLASRLSK